MTTVSGYVYDSSAALVGGRVVRAYRRDTGGLLGKTKSGTGSPTTGDAYYSSVGLLLRFKGANASTTFTDESPSPKTASVAGQAQMSTAQSRWGGSSGLFDGGGDRVQFAHAASLDPVGGDFCVDVSLHVLAWTDATIVAKRTSTGFCAYTIDTTSAGKIFGQVYIGGVGYSATSASTFSIHTWYDVSFERSGNVFKLYVNDIEEATFTQSGSVYSSASDPVVVGCTTVGSRSFNGYLNSLRYTGVARRAAGELRPAEEFLASATIPATSLGSYTINLGTYAGEINVVALDDAAGTTENDLILRTTGV